MDEIREENGVNAREKVKAGVSFIVNNWAEVLGAYSLQFVMFGTLTGLWVLLPEHTLEMLEGYSYPYFWLGLTLSAYPLSALGAGLIQGALSDKIGRKPVLIYIPVGVALGRVMVAFSPNVFFLIFSFGFSGLFGEGLAVCQAVMSDIAPPEMLGTLIGVLLSATALGSMVGAIVTMLLAPTLGFRYFCLLQGIFLVFPHLFIAWTEIAWGRGRRVLIEGAEREKFFTKVKRQIGLVKKCVLNRKSLFLLLNNFLFMFFLSIPYILLPLLVVDVYHLDPAIYASIGYLIEGLVSIPATLIVIPICERVMGTSLALFVSYTLNIIVVVPMPFLRHFWTELVAYALWYVVMTVAASLQISILLRDAEEEVTGTISGTINLLQAAAIALAPFVITILYSIEHWIPMAVFAPCIGICVLICQFLAIESLLSPVKSCINQFKRLKRYIFNSRR